MHYLPSEIFVRKWKARFTKLKRHKRLEGAFIQTYTYRTAFFAFQCRLSKSFARKTIHINSCAHKNGLDEVGRGTKERAPRQSRAQPQPPSLCAPAIEKLIESRVLALPWPAFVFRDAAAREESRCSFVAPCFVSLRYYVSFSQQLHCAY